LKSIFKFIISISLGIIGVIIIYVIAKDTFKKNTSAFTDGVAYYDKGQYEAAEQLFQSEAEKGNRDTYPYLGHIKLVLHKPEEAEKYLLLALEELKKNPNVSVKQNVLLNLGSTYLNLGEDSKAKIYLKESISLGNKEAKNLLIKYNLDNVNKIEGKEIK